MPRVVVTRLIAILSASAVKLVWTCDMSVHIVLQSTVLKASDDWFVWYMCPDDCPVMQASRTVSAVQSRLSALTVAQLGETCIPGSLWNWLFAHRFMRWSCRDCAYGDSVR